MKQYWKILLIITCIASVTSCFLLVRKAVAPKKKYIASMHYRAPYEFAKGCILYYRQKFESHDIVNSFTITAQDFLQTLGIDSAIIGQAVVKYNYVRGYLGLDSCSGKFHIFFTPVEGVITDSLGHILYGGRDIILKGKCDSFAPSPCVPRNALVGDDDSYVLDLNAPCPTTCDFSSAFPPHP